jgi:hypothetical protein
MSLSIPPGNMSSSNKTSTNGAGVAEPRLKIWDNNLGHKFGTDGRTDGQTDGRADRQTDRQTETTRYRVALQLEI